MIVILCKLLTINYSVQFVVGILILTFWVNIFIQEAIPEGGKHFRAIQVDPYMRVLGSSGQVWAMGDAALITRDKAADMADSLFEQADINKDGKLQLKELQSCLTDASKTYSHLEEHA